MVPGQQGDGEQDIFLGLGDADRAELQVDGLAQVGNLCGQGESWGGSRSECGGRRSEVRSAILVSLLGEGGPALGSVEPLQTWPSPEWGA